MTIAIYIPKRAAFAFEVKTTAEKFLPPFFDAPFFFFRQARSRLTMIKMLFYLVAVLGICEHDEYFFAYLSQKSTVPRRKKYDAKLRF